MSAAMEYLEELEREKQVQIEQALFWRDADFDKITEALREIDPDDYDRFGEAFARAAKDDEIECVRLLKAMVLAYWDFEIQASVDKIMEAP